VTNGPHDIQASTGIASRRAFDGRVVAFAIVVLASLAGSVLYAGFAAWRGRAAAGSASGSAAAVAIAVLPDASSARPGATERPFVLFRRTALGPDYGRVSLAYLDELQGQRFVTPLQCDRIHYAAGHGMCLEARRGVSTSYVAHIFDARLAIISSLPLAGPPSRTRISPDGRLAALTVFTSGHSYSTTDFSTRTSLVDAASGHMLVEDLEKFEVLRDGARYRAFDFNFWGVTFARDSNHFFATLGSGGTTYLVEGDIARRTMRVVHQNVECPSLSPDGKHVAFKRRVAEGGLGRFVWRLFVLDLASGNAAAVGAETHSVDDQVDWLDDDHVVYALPDESANGSGSSNLWVASISGSAPRQVLVPSAFSPAIVR